MISAGPDKAGLAERNGVGLLRRSGLRCWAAGIFALDATVPQPLPTETRSNKSRSRALVDGTPYAPAGSPSDYIGSGHRHSEWIVANSEIIDQWLM